MYVYIDGQRINVDTNKSIGKGGEADVYDIGGYALKLFKQPNHPDLSLSPRDQDLARKRLAEMQRKLKDFPKNLPDSVIKPLALATDQKGVVLGYKMPFVKGAEVLFSFSDKDYRLANAGDERMIAILKALLQAVNDVHRGAVISDFNDLNVLVKGNGVYLIDADSMSFGPYISPMFTVRFVDPLLCDPKLTAPMLIKPHNRNSDLYAFRIMLMQCLLFTGPYDGIHVPKDRAKKLKHDERPLKRMTVFNPEVRYNKNARHFKILPDELLDHLFRVFVKDERGEFPAALLDNLRFTACSACGAVHGRNVCPECAAAAPAAIKEKITVRGSVIANRFFRTSGLIVCATVNGGKLNWLYHENNQFKREDGNTVVSGPLQPRMRYRIGAGQTLFGSNGQVRCFKGVNEQDSLGVDSYGHLPIFDANEHHRYWFYSGQLWRDGDFGPELIGEALSNQTLFWVGPKFGFGFYRAGEAAINFVFDAEFKAINDSVILPRINGQLIDSTCFFSRDYAWHFRLIQTAGKRLNSCAVIKSSGEVVAYTEEEAGGGGWLDNIRGKCALGDLLLAPTDDGIMQVKFSGGNIYVAKEFPDTEPFVTAGSKLFAASDGLYVVENSTITRLVIK